MSAKLLLPLALAICLAVPAGAEETINYNIVDLDAASAREVDNDVMIVMMQAVVEANTAAEAARRVNERMSWAADAVERHPAIDQQSLQYTTRPLYQNRQLTGWSVSQQLRLKSEDIELLTETVGTLQEQLQVASMHFEISPEAREAVVAELLVEALEAFRARAELISATLGAADYRLVTIRVGEQGGHIPFPRAVRAEAMMMETAAAPRVEAGESKVTVGAAGSIQLIF